MVAQSRSRHNGNLPSALRRWETLITGMEHKDFELTVEEFAPILATFRYLRRSGVQFDRCMIALMGILERQCFGSPDDGDWEPRDPGSRPASCLLSELGDRMNQPAIAAGMIAARQEGRL